MRRMLVASAVAAALGASWAGYAIAHAKEDGAWTYFSGADCTWTAGRIADGVYDKGFARATGQAWYVEPVRSYFCFVRFDRPAGYLAARWEYFRYRDGAWRLCAGSDWRYNSATTWSYSVYWNFRTIPCGKGHYRARGHGWQHNGSWKGGAISSPSHYFPTS